MGGWQGGGAKGVLRIVVRSLTLWFAQLFLFGKGSVVPSRQPASQAATCRILARQLRDCN